MLRILINNVASSSGWNISSNPVCVQCVRWRRKPRWLPTAKSKLFRVPERKVQPEDEKIELQRLNNNYRTEMRSLRAFLREEARMIRETSTADHLIVTPEQEAEEFRALVALNDEWNAKCAAIRADRLKKETEEKRNKILKHLDEKEHRDQEERERIEEIVRLEKERSKTFVNKENLDKAIEFALANPVDPNFAIDLTENIHPGRISKTKKNEKVAVASS